MFRKLLLAGALAVLPATAFAGASSVVSGGPRFGFSVSPDQVVLGGQLTITGFSPRWSFDPSLDVGLGSDRTIIAFNGDLLYHARMSGSDWKPYMGAGLGVNSISIDMPPGVRDDTETDLALNLALGFDAPLASGNHWFGELRFGLGNSEIPDLKLLAGLRFRL